MATKRKKSKSITRATGRAKVSKRGGAGGGRRRLGGGLAIDGDAIIIEASSVETPTNIYDADVAWIEHRTGTLSIFFAKSSRDRPDSLKSRLQLRYPVEAFVTSFWRQSREFYERLGTYVNRWPGNADEGDMAMRDWPSEKEHSEWVNFAYIAHAGTGAALDFYLIPFSATARYRQTRDPNTLEIRPIVRVQLTVFQLARLLAEAREVAGAIEKYWPEAEALEAKVGAASVGEAVAEEARQT